MTINGEGNTDDNLKTDKRKSVGGLGNSLNFYYPNFEYVDGKITVPQRKIKKRMRFPKGELRARTQFQLQPKNAVKRHQVSLTHFPRGRRNEEVSLIRQQYFRNGRSPVHTRNARYAKRQHMTIPSPGYYKNRRGWLFRSRCCGDQLDPSGRLPYELYRRQYPSEDLSPGTYMVQVEQEAEEDRDEGDAGAYTTESRPPPPTKLYYLFEKTPFKVKFLNYVPSPWEEYVQPRTEFTPSLDQISLRLIMPPFRCKPPECREVLYCKYFQCMSLGFFPDSRNCRKYFFCDLNYDGFVLYHMLCPKGRIFDPDIRECRLKEVMDKREVQKCYVEAAKSRRGKKIRIKKDDSDDLIKYKTPLYVPYGRWKRKRVPGDRRKANIQRIRGRNLKNQSDVCFYRNCGVTQQWTTNSPPCNITKACPLSKYCEMLMTMTTPSPATSPPNHTAPTCPPKAGFGTPPPPTTIATTTATTTSTTTQKTTILVCHTPVQKNKTCVASKKQYYLGDLDSEAYQEDMQDYNYDMYYDGDYPPDKSTDDYDWLRQGLTEYLDKLKLKQKDRADGEIIDTLTGKTTPAHSNDPNENQNQQQKELSKVTDGNSNGGITPVVKTSTSTTIPEQTEVPSENLPDFEKSYKEQKSMNLDGYPCREYARYPDKFDNVCYYECGVQPDGNMRIEHKCCQKGEEFSPQYLECVATEYLKMTHRKRSASHRVQEVEKPIKKPIPEPEDTYDEDRDVQNEWLDASRPNKVPNEFKSKSKNTLRIFHLHCRRNSSEKEDAHADRKTSIRSFKNTEEESQKMDDDEGDDYDDEEEEDYEEESEKTTLETRSTSEKPSSESSSLSTVKESTTTSKVLLDADIRVGRDFENALKSILGKTDELEKDQKRDSKDSILIRLSGNKPRGRTKRNFFKSFFAKKSKNNGDDPDKEGVVSMMTLINGLPSDYERDVLLQKLERRKMISSHLFRPRQGMRKRKKIENGNDAALLRQQS